MVRLILSIVSTFFVYVVCKNLDWTGLIGTMLLCITMGGFIMNELRLILKELQKKL